MEPSPATVIPRENLNLWKVFRDVGHEGEKILSSAKLAHVDDATKGFVVTLGDETYSFLRDKDVCKITRIPELCHVRVKEFFVSSIYLALTDHGALYSWIKEDYRNLPKCDDDVQKLGRIKPATLDWGHSDTMTLLVTPHLVEGGLTGKTVRQVAVSLDGRVMALTVGGDVYQWGKLGFPPEEPVLIEMEPFHGQRVVSIACTDNVSLALTFNGKIFQWEFGRSLPQKVVIWEPCIYKKICASKNLLFALTWDGSLHCLQNRRWEDILALRRRSFVWAGTFGSQKLQDIATFGCRNDKIVVEVKDDTRFAFGYSVFGGSDTRKVLLGTGESISFLPNCSTVDDFFPEISGSTVRTMCAQNVAKPRTLVDDIGNLWSDKDDADVTFSVEGKNIRAHKLILKSRSDYFMKMFNKVWKESDQGVIEMKDTKYEIFEALLFYIYHERVPFSEGDYVNILGLMKLADSHCHDKLRDDCEKILVRNISEENVFFLVQNAPSANALNLEEMGIKFMYAGQARRAQEVERRSD